MSILVFEHSPLAGAIRLGQSLRSYGHRLRVISIHEGQSPPGDLDDVDGIVTCGGPQSANDSQRWLEDEMACIRAAHEAGMPVVGLCLGSQIAARALGGTVGPLEGGIEMGWHEVVMTDAGREDIIHSGLPWTGMQFHWHREHVIKPPPGARVLAKSKRCAVQSWALGLRTYGFQYHPEVEMETIEAWAEDEPGDLTDGGVSLERLRGESAQHYPAFRRLTQRMFENIALFLAPVERRYRGLLKDVLH
jgi:GMP synthase-like glutamine amidotransferase